VAVFIDSQNAYRDARRSFFDDKHDAATVGQFDPLKLALILARRSTSSFPGDQRQLSRLQLYTGLPDPLKDKRGYAATSRQIGKWGNHPLVRVFARPLLYPHRWPVEPPRQKGVDVWLAVHFLAMAIRGEYDVGIMFSRDTDLVPALEEALAVGQHVCCEVVTWAPTATTGRRLRIPGRPLFCHYLNRTDFDAVEDRNDYNQQ
jgi:uncharacterized LabA/DUF88 family protein